MVEGKGEIVEPQSVFFTFPWEEHGSRDEYEPGHYWHWVVLWLNENEIHPRESFSLHPALGFSREETDWIWNVLNQSSHRSIRATREIAWILPRLVQECRSPAALSEAVCQSLTRLLVLELVRCIEGKKAADVVIPGVETRMNACLQKIRERCMDPWTLESMSRESGLSRTRFSDLLKRKTGDTPTLYLRRQRIRYAQERLRTTSRSITEIALDAGFETSQHFARIFKFFVRQTAGQYRKTHRRGEGEPPDSKL